MAETHPDTDADSHPDNDSGTDSGIRVTTDDAVRTVTFARPERRNGMDLAMFRGYFDALAEADRDPRVRAIVVTGDGGSFCSGATPALLDELTGPAARRDLAEHLGHPPHLPLTLRTPLVAAVNGSAAGLGLVHALGADVRFLADSAQLSTVFARLGLVAEYGAAWLLPRLVGTGAAMDLLLSARPVGAREALRIGLVQYVTPRAEVKDRATEYARQLAATCSPASLAAIKGQVLRGLDQGAQAAVAESVALMRESFESPDFTEAMRAVRARRKPVF
ncbi:enoyl-CoA hydratase/isomerase family protein [Streptomyces sp. NPDC050560]|uniref:enoyl-CoA hydratase/isomerase family protein n=1 Tax=Streptomyces sp. NPDC050560 TaxID=3365630 RepID=UPI0037B6C07D